MASEIIPLSVLGFNMDCQTLDHDTQGLTSENWGVCNNLVSILGLNLWVVFPLNAYNSTHDFQEPEIFLLQKVLQKYFIEIIFRHIYINLASGKFGKSLDLYIPNIFKEELYSLTGNCQHVGLNI